VTKVAIVPNIQDTSTGVPLVGSVRGKAIFDWNAALAAPAAFLGRRLPPSWVRNGTPFRPGPPGVGR
jgi:hypothetical protein